MRNYVHTFVERDFVFKFFSKNNYNEVRAFTKEIEKKNLKFIVNSSNTKNNFIILTFKEKKTLIDIKSEIFELLQEYKNKNHGISFEIIQNQDTCQLASLVTNFKIPELDLYYEYNNIDENINSEIKSNASNNADNKFVINEKEKKIIQTAVDEFLIHFKQYLKTNFNYHSVFDNIILSYSYQFDFKKLIIIIPLEFYNTIVISYFNKHNIEITKKENIKKNNKIINANPLIVLNYKNFTCYFKEFMNICGYCKKYHRIFNKNSNENNLCKTCSGICTKCGFISVKGVKIQAHTCEDTSNKICHVCKHYYNEEFNHVYKDSNCQHHKILLENFIQSNRISSVLENKLIKKTNFIFDSNEYPLLNKNIKKIKENDYDKENDFDKEKEKESLSSSSLSISTDSGETYEQLESINNDTETEKILNETVTIEKINNIHNYKITLFEDKEIKKGDEINIKLLINGKEYILNTIIQ